MNTHGGETALQLHFWGTRGSAGLAGIGTNVYGGHTICLEVAAGGHRVIVDAGTGIVPLGLALDAKPGDHFDLLLTHLHHDHVVGLMLFAPLFVRGVTVDIYCGNLGGRSAEEALRRMFSPPLFPLTFDDLPAAVRFIGFSAGTPLDIGGRKVLTCPLDHPGGATAYRIGRDNRAVAILTDVEHRGEATDPAPELVAFCRGADLIVYDATFDDVEYPNYRGWGHSTWEAGAALARAASARQLGCFHHAPEHDDTRLADMEKRLRAAFPGGFFARDGQVVELGSHSASG